MRDVETQLREYFDAAVERVTADDILAGWHVTEEADRRRQRWMLRPAWAAVATFAATVVVLGGSLALGAAFRQPGFDAGARLIPEAVSHGVAATSSGWLLPAIGVAVAVAVATAVALILKNHQILARRENAMATTVKTTPTQQQDPAERTNRWLVVTIVVLAIGLLALGAWVMYDQASAPDTAATDEINTLYDDYVASWMDKDDEAFLALTTEYYINTSLGMTTTQSERAARLILPGSLQVERVGDLVVVGDGPEYYVTVAEQVTYNGSEFVGVSAYRVIDTGDSLKIAEHAWVGNL